VDARRVFRVRGFERDPVQGLHLRHVGVREASEVGVVEHVRDIVTENVLTGGAPYEPR
jgi:hypothetical protein